MIPIFSQWVTNSSYSFYMWAMNESKRFLSWHWCQFDIVTHRAASRLIKIKTRRNRAVVKWYSRSPSIPTIPVRIPLTAKKSEENVQLTISQWLVLQLSADANVVVFVVVVTGEAVIVLLKTYSHPNGFYLGHRCSWTLTQANSVQVSIMQSGDLNRN